MMYDFFIDYEEANSPFISGGDFRSWKGDGQGNYSSGVSENRPGDSSMFRNPLPFDFSGGGLEQRAVWFGIYYLLEVWFGV